jgi:hypothetical protein
LVICFKSKSKKQSRYFCTPNVSFLFFERVNGLNGFGGTVSLAT